MRGSELPVVHEVELRTAHDVRRLVRCGLCGGLGDRSAMLTNLGCVGLAGHLHGRCVVRHLTSEAVLHLPAGERSKLRLNDTGVELMRRLLDAAD